MQFCGMSICSLCGHPTFRLSAFRNSEPYRCSRCTRAYDAVFGVGAKIAEGLREEMKRREDGNDA